MTIQSLDLPEIPHPGTLIGIEVGSVTVSFVQVDFSGQILKAVYLFHKGRIRECFRSAEGQLDMSAVQGVAVCNAHCFQPGMPSYNPQVAVISATKRLCSQARSLLLVGAEKFMLVRFDEEGNFESERSNSSCAAGTGSFLDQQASRLNLSGTGELSAIALKNRQPIPDIASRCAVFAKTDLIHAQQRGYSIEAICDSLCKGLAINIVDTLFNQDIPPGPIFFAGGVSKNGAVVRHLEELLNQRFLMHEYAHCLGAAGACYLWLNEKQPFSLQPVASLANLLLPANTVKSYFYPPLEITISDYPDFSRAASGNFRPPGSSPAAEVQVEYFQALTAGSSLETYMGIDIGSTSTKAILTTTDNLPLAGFYAATSGNPVEAIRAVFEAIAHMTSGRKVSLSFLGVGTTGSGRKFIGKIIHADLVLDEITAHARAAFELNPATDTIIEIGGQDSKFTLMTDGRVTFSQMNAVCAAGTGSFLEEQARKLDCPLAAYTQLAPGVSSPLASDRCTVFMERDINHLLNQGYTVSEILA
ncbi:MAG: BadF/BadG/BcrA/BcrD ATPase family protein, partial [Bacteroidota bacterium]